MSSEAFYGKSYLEQLDDKVNFLRNLVQPFNVTNLEVFASHENHYRMRAEFRIWHEESDLYHIMFEPITKKRIRIDQFPIANQLINQLMQTMIKHLRVNSVVRQKLFQIDYLTTCSGQAIVSLLYHRKLDEVWHQHATRLLKHLRLELNNDNLHLIGRAANQKIVLQQDFIEESLIINGKPIVYRQVENSFTQPNAFMNTKMIEWALDVTSNQLGDLLELYCGNGNFTIPLSRNFKRVLATEIAKPSVAAAQTSLLANHISNVAIIRMSSEEFSQALKGIRLFNRLKNIALDSYQCETILVDPPRGGLDEQTLSMVKNHRNILYISCNPKTLCENLTVLNSTHQIQRFALFDQFPYTSHIESGVWLVRRQ